MAQQAESSGWDVATKLEHSHGGVPCVATAEIRRLQAENEALRTALAQHYIDQRAKELPELPEPDVYEYDIETAMNVLKAHSPDQLQSYGAACAAQAREHALSDAAESLFNLDIDSYGILPIRASMVISDCNMEIQKLKAGE